MFGKKIEVQENAYDINLKALITQWRESRNCLMGRVQSVITKKNVINLYPDGADKQLAIQTFQKEQKILLNYIADYDIIYNKLMTFEYSKCNKIKASKEQYERATSHEIIEIAYQNFIK